jgi:hypothetical protein
MLGRLRTFPAKIYTFFHERGVKRGPSVARFFSVQHTKTVEKSPNSHKIYQMAMKYTNWL